MLKKLEVNEDFLQSEAQVAEDKNQPLSSDLEPTGIDGYGQEYNVNVELRREFQNSYFLDEIYDDAIWGVNPVTGSIIYEFELLGFLHAWHVEGTYADLGDRYECAAITISWVERLTQEILQGKVMPTFIFPTEKMENWEYLKDRLYLPSSEGDSA